MRCALHLYVLASGSRGNAAVVEGPEGSILIDCGLSRKTLRARADEVGCDLDRIRATLVTHEHADHTSGLSVVVRHLEGPLCATAGTVAARPYLTQLPFTLVDHDVELDLGGIHVVCFPTSHDALDPMGFRFEAYEETADGDVELVDAIGWMSDTGYVTDEALDALYGCRILAIEANHDTHMLMCGRYPAYLKRRVASEVGHLSNEQTAAVLSALVTRDTECVVALHLSQENNRPAIAVRALGEALGAVLLEGADVEARTADGRLSVCAASQDEPLCLW